MEDEVPSEGVFDSENLASFWAFAEFLRLVVLHSSTDLEESIRHHSTSSLNKLCAWRADNNINCAASWMAEIARWSRHVLDRRVLTINDTNWTIVDGVHSVTSSRQSAELEANASSDTM